MRAETRPDVAATLARWAHGIELDDAGRRVPAEERALRPAKHLDHLEIEHRETLQDRVFLYDVVIHKRYRLRCVEVEVRVAEAADIEARESAAEGRLDIQARQARREETDVVAAGCEDVELLVGERRHRDRDILDVLAPALSGDDDLSERRGFGRALGPCGRQRQRHGDGGGEIRATHCSTPPVSGGGV